LFRGHLRTWSHPRRRRLAVNIFAAHRDRAGRVHRQTPPTTRVIVHGSRERRRRSMRDERTDFKNDTVSPRHQGVLWYLLQNRSPPGVTSKPSRTFIRMLRYRLYQCKQVSGVIYSSLGTSLRTSFPSTASPVHHDNSSKIPIFTASPNRNQPLLQHRPARLKLSSQLISVVLPIQQMG